MTKKLTPKSPRKRGPVDPTFREHYDGSQLRVETWNNLKDLTERLARGPTALGDEFESVKNEVERTLDVLKRIERYWAFPGKQACRELTRTFQRGQRQTLERETARVVRLLVSDGYRKLDLTRARASDALPDEDTPNDDSLTKGGPVREARPYFEILVVDDLERDEQREMRQRMLEMRSDDDDFVYDVVTVPSFEDAVIAVLLNYNIQACILRYRFPIESTTKTPSLRQYLDKLEPHHRDRARQDPAGGLAETIKHLRPELDVYKVTDDTIGSVAASRTRCFRRVFYRQEDYLELHLSILKGLHERYDTPFFTALKEYSHRPTGVFHALPISRGKSITKSHWIGDMGKFYGRNIFLAETSSTSGGLDSLLQPTGPLKLAQQKFARAFGSRHSFFVTNGTSTANKIVMQALVRPGDLVLLSHDCHKSHPYALVLSGAQPVYLDAYPLSEFAMFGGVPLTEIKRRLFALKAAGKLDQVRMLLLTNCTFDGITYDPYRVMLEVLAIKPDMVFLWDEAWFAFACATPTYRQRTAMAAAHRLRELFASDWYKERYAEFRAEFDTLDPNQESTWLDRELLPDPAAARIRVYATHSTHKTLTSLRQGSAIHVWDQDFERSARMPFHEAYMTHTSTSPNYQILASLDVSRRQLELEGYEFVRNMIGLAMMIRRQIVDHPLLRKYFRVLRAKDLIPAEFRPSGLEKFYDRKTGFAGMIDHWRQDEFALDPTRITMHVGATGWDGDTFRKMLIEKFDIQINKTSRNTILLMLNIGTSRGSATYLLDVLVRIAEDLEMRAADRDAIDSHNAEERVHELSDEFPPLPHFTRFHAAFVDNPKGETREGDMRAAFFLAYDTKNCDYAPIEHKLPDDRDLVSAAFVTPYPPGFPVLVPGQTITEDILEYLRAVDVKEIHGYDPERGLLVFRQDVLDDHLALRNSQTALPTA